MKLELTLWERVVSAQIIGAMANLNLTRMRMGSRLLDFLELPPKEAKAVGLVTLPDGGTTWADKANDNTYELEIKDPELANLFKREVNRFNGWRMRDHEKAFVLAEKLGLEEEDD